MLKCFLPILFPANYQAVPLKQRPLNICPGFSCTSGFGKCIPSKKRCNGIVDCLNGEDESGCESHINYGMYRESVTDSIDDSSKSKNDNAEQSTTPTASTASDIGNFIQLINRDYTI